MGATEISLKRSTLTKLKTLAPDILIFSVADRFARGRPDILLMRRGKTLWIEFKKWPNTPSKIQEEVMSRLKTAGQRVLVIQFKEDMAIIGFRMIIERKELANFLIQALEG